MRYTKPVVVSCFMASKSIMGMSKSRISQDNVSSDQPLFSTASAYQADE